MITWNINIYHIVSNISRVTTPKPKENAVKLLIIYIALTVCLNKG